MTEMGPKKSKNIYYPVLCPPFKPYQKPIHLKGKSDPLQTAKNRKCPTERGKNKEEVEIFKS